MKHTNNSEAVSPVIGVIVMVAVTVMLAAIVAAFVFGMAGEIKDGKVVSVIPHRDNATQITFTNYGGADVSKLSADISVIAYDSAGVAKNDTLATVVGSSTPINGDFAGNNRVVATGTFFDGTVSVLLDTTV